MGIFPNGKTGLKESVAIANHKFCGFSFAGGGVGLEGVLGAHSIETNQRLAAIQAAFIGGKQLNFNKNSEFGGILTCLVQSAILQLHRSLAK